MAPSAVPPPRRRLVLALASAAAAAVCRSASAAVAAAPSACEASEDGAGAAECLVPQSAPRDHLLLQAGSAFEKALVSRHAHGAGASASCSSLSVRRRRRNEAMTSCRRRHSSAGWDDTDLPEAVWTCDEQQNQMVCDSSKAEQAIGFPATGSIKSEGLWCAVPMPPDDWNLKSCPLSGSTSKTTIKVLTYNLFWWNLFDQRGGSGRSAGKLIAQTSGPEEYDIMGFQECDDRDRVVSDAKLEGLSGEYEALDGGRAVAIAYRKSRFTLLAHGTEDVGEDSPEQWYGKRTAQWARLQHRDGKVVFFVNHHGPLPVGASGGCAGSATAINIMRLIADNAHKDDAIILVGDFNAPAHSSRIVELDRRLNRVFSGTEMDGVDHVFANCAADAQGANLGKGKGEYGSDHDALSVTFKI